MIGLEPDRPRRDYRAIASAIGALTGDRESRMRIVVDALWEALHNTGVSWIGFYLGEGESMVLGPRRDKPACSPIELHGICGKSYLSREAIVVRDVRALGDNYIACDPRDLSELVVPAFDESGCWGVLDVDSFDVGAFGTSDATGLAELLVEVGLSTTTDEPLIVRTM